MTNPQFNPDDEDAKDVWLVQQLMATAELLGQQMTPTAAAVLAADLSTYPQPVIAHALSRVRAEHGGRLTGKAILDRIDDAVGRPTAHEAWAIALTSLDERATVVWSNEMSDAWLLAGPLARAGDKFGARNAFVSAYERIVRAAKDAKALPTVTVSIGWDSQARDAAIEKALSIGYVSLETILRAGHYLERAIALGHLTVAQAVEREYITELEAADLHSYAVLAAPTFNPVGLLTGRIEPAAGAAPDTRARIAAMRKDLDASARKQEAEKETERLRQAVDLRQKKADVQRKVDEKMAADRWP